MAARGHPAGFVPLRRAALIITWGLPALGVVQAAKLLAVMLRTPSQGIFSWTDCLLEMISTIGAYALAGVGIGALFRALEEWVLVSLVGQHAPDRDAPTNLAKQSSSLAAQPHGQEGPEPSPEPAARQLESAVDRHREGVLAEIRQAIRSAKWDVAEAHLAAFSSDHADAPRLAELQDELQAARSKTRDELLAQLDAARQVNDPERVLELHQDLVPLLEAEARTTLDSELSRWFLRLIHNRLRGSKIQADLAHLAGRIAEAFDHTLEGASLRASLPTLRRSAGLCPRCARPYTGIDDACPVCLKQGGRPRLPAQPNDGHAKPE